MLYFAPWKFGLVVAVLALGVLFFSPNLIPADMRLSEDGKPKGVFTVLPSKALNLGLDLQGGSHLLLEVDVDKVQKDRLETAQVDARAVLREAKIEATGFAVVGDEVVLRVTDPAKTDAAAKALKDKLAEPIEPGPGAQIGGARSFAVTGAESGEIRMSVTPEMIADLKRRTVRQSIEIIRKRIDPEGVTEPVIARQGESRILVQVAGDRDPEALKRRIDKTAQMTFHMVVSDDPADIIAAQAGRVSPLHKYLPQDDPREPGLIVEKRPRLSGEDLRRAAQGYNPDSGDPIVNFWFNTKGAVIFGELTRKNIDRRFAVVLDDVIITAPHINSAIPQGQGYIEGNFTVESAKELAALLNAGALPAPLKVVEQRSVDPTLGKESVEAGRLALGVGFLAVVAFMLVAYRALGVIANIALLANVILLLGALSILGATLTLPGIGGIILTVGMAVDANVLIFERIREESRLGRTPLSAAEAGYQRALGTILDSNITTLIAGVILYVFGSGPVRGFAATLSIGIVTSVFTAFVFARLLTSTWLKVGRPRVLAF